MQPRKALFSQNLHTIVKPLASGCAVGNVVIMSVTWKQILRTDYSMLNERILDITLYAITRPMTEKHVKIRKMLGPRSVGAMQ